MKRLLVPLALALLLCACTPPALDSTATPETAESATYEAATADTAQAGVNVSLPEGLQAVDLAVLPYDDIRLVCRYSVYNEPVSGYYTTCRDGQWGLIRNDGSEVLSCAYERPIAMCSDTAPFYPSWITMQEKADATSREETSRYLTSIGEGRLCDMAHCGPGYERFYWLTDRNQMCAYIGNLGPAMPAHISPRLQEEFGNIFPTQDAVLVSEEWGDVPHCEADVPFRYRRTDGTPLNNYEYQQAQPFLHGALLAVARRGSKWVYLDGLGKEVTAPVYDGVYQTLWEDAFLASPLLNGYAAVCRDGKFGLLDSAGKEFVPCDYDGLAWDGNLGWLKLADGWHAFSVPSAPSPTVSPVQEEEPDLLRNVSIYLVFPDRYPSPGIHPEYTTIRDDNLNVRAGPGTEYDKISSLYPGSRVEVLGSSSTVDGWVFVAYQDWPCGWVSAEYLE